MVPVERFIDGYQSRHERLADLMRRLGICEELYRALVRLRPDWHHEDDERGGLKVVMTGFDAPSLHTMYVDKPMRGHGLMQAIARVNRVFKDKPGGLVEDALVLVLRPAGMATSPLPCAVLSD